MVKLYDTKIIHWTPVEFYSNHDIWLVTAQIVIERRTTGRQMRMIYTEEVFEMRGRMWKWQ